MLTNESTGWIGKWEVIINDIAGNEIERTEVRPNMIMDAGLNMMRDLLSGAITDGEIKYVALGDGSAPTAAGQVALQNERFRKIVTAQSNDTQPGKLFTDLFVADFEANNFECQEIGWFAGAGSTTTSGSGIMVARVLYHRQKTNLESWTIRRTDTITRG